MNSDYRKRTNQPPSARCLSGSYCISRRYICWCTFLRHCLPVGLLGRVAQAFDLAGARNIVGAPSFAHFAKGGNLERMRDRVAEPTKVCRQHRYPPLQKTQGRGTLSIDGAHRHHQRAILTLRLRRRHNSHPMASIRGCRGVPMVPACSNRGKGRNLKVNFLQGRADHIKGPDLGSSRQYFLQNLQGLGIAG